MVELSIDSEVELVTFFEDRAEVVRVARFELSGGPARVKMRRLTLLAGDRSVRSRVRSGSAEVVFTRIRRTVEAFAEESAEAIAALEAELVQTRDDLARLDRALANESAESKRFGAMLRLWAETVATVPSRMDEASLELARAYDALDAAVKASLDHFGELRARREDAGLAAQAAEARLAQARARRPRYEAFAEVELVASSAGPVELELVYRTPCALWRPEHRAHLSFAGGEGEIRLTTYAAVWQRTGEDWRDVPTRFSTARPARSSGAPALADDILASRKKTEVERRQLVVEARDQAIALAGAARGTRDVEEMPGVDDGGAAQWLTGRSPATIESDGRPVRIELGERMFRCHVARVAYPELSAVTHLRATATLPGGAPLLPGPVVLARGTEIVGRGVVGFSGAGEPFELGFGIDDGLRVRRRLVERRKTTPVTGTQHVAREVRLYVSNLAGDARQLSVVERVPVSEVEDVLVEVERQPQMRFEARDGFVTFDLDLPPGATREVVLRYRIEAKSNVVLPPSPDAEVLRE